MARRTPTGPPLADPTKDSATALAFTPDGRRLIARDDSGVALWDLETKQRTELRSDLQIGFSVSPARPVAALTAGDEKSRSSTSTPASS